MLFLQLVLLRGGQKKLSCIQTFAASVAKEFRSSALLFFLSFFPIQNTASYMIQKDQLPHLVQLNMILAVAIDSIVILERGAL